LGLELRECLEGLNNRVPESFELRLFTGAVMLNRDTGGNLIEILENLARTIRERVVFEGKVKALTAEVRASANILSSLPIGAAVLLAVVEPNYLIPLTEPGLGQYMVAGGFVSMSIGMYLMRRLAEVEM
jgi:tight adherence protein B